MSIAVMKQRKIQNIVYYVFKSRVKFLFTVKIASIIFVAIVGNSIYKKY